ncbi:MAG: hypothetical protein K0R66_89 [Gammaproteobacteria bacterium]|jgi:hypothetical protein|nr:hypothetical protein [Gammaproteobacteria bacterium]
MKLLGRLSFISLLILPAFAGNALTATVNNGVRFGSVGVASNVVGVTVSINTFGQLATNNPSSVDFVSGSGAGAGSVSLSGGTPFTIVSYSLSFNSFPDSSAISVTNASTDPSGSCNLDGSGSCNINIGATVMLTNPTAGTYEGSNIIVMTLDYI